TSGHCRQRFRAMGGAGLRPGIWGGVLTEGAGPEASAPVAVSRRPLRQLRQQENIFAVDINSSRFTGQVSFAMTHGWMCKHSARKRPFIRRQGWTATLCLYTDRTAGGHCLDRHSGGSPSAGVEQREV